MVSTQGQKWYALGSKNWGDMVEDQKKQLQTQLWNIANELRGYVRGYFLSPDELFHHVAKAVVYRKELGIDPPF